MPATVARRGIVKLDSGPEVAAETGALGPGEGCAAVVRPEKLRVLIDGDGAAANGSPSVEGVVESSVYLGTATQIVVGLGEGVRMTVLVPNADEAERQRLPGGGARVRLSWEPEHMHVVTESPGEAVPAAAAESAGGEAELASKEEESR
jgi:ABC-type Fe3+/spermidine/putrescine transport system ATPase subunit